MSSPPWTAPDPSVLAWFSPSRPILWLPVTETLPLNVGITVVFCLREDFPGTPRISKLSHDLDTGAWDEATLSEGSFYVPLCPSLPLHLCVSKFPFLTFLSPFLSLSDSDC